MKPVSEWTSYFWANVHGRHLQQRLGDFVRYVQEDAAGTDTVEADDNPVVVEAPELEITDPDFEVREDDARGIVEHFRGEDE